MPDDPAARPIEIDMTDVDHDDAPSPTTSPPVRRILLASLLTVTVAAAATLGYVGWQVVTQKDATLTTPDTIGALTLDRSSKAADVVGYLQVALTAGFDVEKTVGAVYHEGDRVVILVGSTDLFWTPENDLDSAFELVSDNEADVTDVHEVSAGDLGGTMKCGTSGTGADALTVCGWADHGSLAIALFSKRSESDSAALLRTIRAATQKR